MYVIFSILDLAEVQILFATYRLQIYLQSQLFDFNPYFPCRTAMSSSPYFTNIFHNRWERLCECCIWISLHISIKLLHKTDVKRNTQYRNTELSSSIIIPAHHSMFSKQYHTLPPSQSCSKYIFEPLQYAWSILVSDSTILSLTLSFHGNVS